MGADPANPYEPPGSAEKVADATPRRWPVVLCACICTYYLVSAVTLPLVNKLWLGELPLLAIVQLPKSVVKSVVHQVLMSMVHSFGLSRGSFSPDYMATHGWAMIAMVTVPALFVIVVFSLMRSLPRCRLIGALVTCAALDAIVTLWFDSVSNLKLYNAIYW